MIKFQRSPVIELKPGDANLDGLVDVGDLGILAANYGQSNKTREQGDFNDDGVVDVGDLGILAANYGSGSSDATLDFNVDYARVFAEVVNEDTSTNDNTSETSSSICSTAGLPLVMGILLTGLLLNEFWSEENEKIK